LFEDHEVHREGVIPGRGVALIRAQKSLDKNPNASLCPVRVDFFRCIG
jgi:hypothetical protein